MKRILKHPVTILLGAAIGIYTGLINGQISGVLGINNFSKILSVPGELFIFFLQMAAIPLVITAVASGLGKLMQNKTCLKLFGKIVYIFIIFMILCAVTGMAAGFLGKPGSGFNGDSRSFLFKFFAAEQEASVMEANAGIFYILPFGSIMAILFFSVIFGIAIGFLPKKSASLLVNLCTLVFQALQKIISGSLCLLPFALICIFANLTAAAGLTVFTAMSDFLIMYGIGIAAIWLICTIIIALRSGVYNPFKLFSMLFEPSMIAFASRSQIQAVPSAVECLEKKMKFNSSEVNLTLPAGMTLGSFANIFYFALAVFFTAQIYNMSFEPMHYFIIFAGVILAGNAAVGAPGIASLPLISIILKPLGLPVEAVLVILIVLNPIIEPFRNFLIVYVSMAASSLIASRGNDSNEKVPEILYKKTNDHIEIKQKTVKKNKDSKKFIVNKDSKKLLVYVRETKLRMPLLHRRSGVLEGLEISLIHEIGQRLNREIVLKDSVNLSFGDDEKIIREANIIAGIVIKTSMPPEGFYCSESWAYLKSKGKKKPVCFLLPEGNNDSAQIDGIIKILKTENFIKTLTDEMNTDADT